MYTWTLGRMGRGRLELRGRVAAVGRFPLPLLVDVAKVARPRLHLLLLRQEVVSPELQTSRRTTGSTSMSLLVSQESQIRLRKPFLCAITLTPDVVAGSYKIFAVKN